jgi:hypothetical protein
MDEDAADRASQEIKALIKRLHPKESSHKDRIRRLNKFRNFVGGEGVSACRRDSTLFIIVDGRIVCSLSVDFIAGNKMHCVYLVINI